MRPSRSYELSGIDDLVKALEDECCSLSLGKSEEQIRMWFRFYATKHTSASPPHSDIRRITIDLSKAVEIPLTSECWAAFEDILLGLEPQFTLPSLEIVIGQNENALKTILEGDTLSKIEERERLSLRVPGDTSRKCQWTTKEKVLQSQEEHTVNGVAVKLSLIERLHYLTCGDKNKYLQSLPHSKMDNS